MIMMEAIKTKGELEHALSTVLMNGKTDQLRVQNELGKFECRVTRHQHFSLLQHEYTNEGPLLTIPITRKTPCITMIFQFGGYSAYRDKHNPFLLPCYHQSINYFNMYDCRSLVDERMRQHDITFVLDDTFYNTLLHDGVMEGNLLTEKILNREEFNTINARQPIDAGVQGVLHNILHCPFKNGMRDMYITAQLKALMMLQCCQFHYAVSDKPAPKDAKLTSRDRDTLMAIYDFLTERYHDETTLTDLSRRFGINEFKLKYGFRKLFDTSPIKYIQDRRLQFAGLLLRNTNKSITEVADEIGYEHANNFSIAFRKKFGVAPQVYRNGLG
jgi:AraC-like DNA-binding protein